MKGIPDWIKNKNTQEKINAFRKSARNPKKDHKSKISTRTESPNPVGAYWVIVWFNSEQPIVAGDRMEKVAAEGLMDIIKEDNPNIEIRLFKEELQD